MDWTIMDASSLSTDPPSRVEHWMDAMLTTRNA